MNQNKTFISQFALKVAHVEPLNMKIALGGNIRIKNISNEMFWKLER